MCHTPLPAADLGKQVFETREARIAALWRRRQDQQLVPQRATGTSATQQRRDPPR